MARQLTTLVPLGFQPSNFTWSTGTASLIVGLALLPPVMRWLNRGRTRVTWESVFAAFSIGFFIDLSSAKVLGLIWRTMTG
jgi:hypothetical protein